MLIKKLILFVAACCFFVIAFAADVHSPVGTWETISDRTGDKAGLVQIFAHGSELSGKVIKIFPGNGRSVTDRCENCPPPFTNKPNLGLTIMWGLTPDGANSWSGGQILDPKEGKIYRVSMTLSDDGQQLQVKGHWGPFSRTQTWYRVK